MEQTKIEDSLRFISDILDVYKNPVVLSSFGKDSMVLLHLVRLITKDIPVIYYRELAMPKKQKFANSVIHDWDLVIHDYPPNSLGFNCRGDHVMAHTLRYQDIGGGKTIAVGTGLYPPVKEKEFLCTLNDLYLRPTGSINFQWDICFHGHKSTDKDNLLGVIPLQKDILKTQGAASICYPLRYWTDADIWDYSEENKLPINKDRYQKYMGKWHEMEDKEMNPDCFYACWKCMDKSQAESVLCPKTGEQTHNVGKSIYYDEMNYVNTK